MRIRDNDSTPILHSSSHSEAAVSKTAEGKTFPDVLQNLIGSESTLGLQTAHMQLHMELNTRASANDITDQELDDIAINASQEQEESNLERNEVQSDLLENREDADIEDMIENQEAMEDLIEEWEDQGDLAEDLALDEAESLEEELLQEEIVDGEDDTPELLPTPHDEQQKEKEQENAREDDKGEVAGVSPPENHQITTERDLTYQEIQMLMESTLESKNKLQSRVRKVLRTLLESLSQGKRFLLDQHRLAGLDSQEWKEITQLFPPHFYGGLVRQAIMKGPKTLNHLHKELQNIYKQQEPDAFSKKFWQALWEPLLGNWPLLMHNWLHNHPLPEDTEALKNVLEILQQHNAMPIGAIGQALQLAVTYQHNPETFHHLFTLTQKWLHGQGMSKTDRNLLSDKIYERCYPQNLSGREQITTYLDSLLQRETLPDDKLMQILQGCNQGVLSYLPYRYLPPEIQELQDYVRQDLLGKEEAVIQLLVDSDHPLNA